MIAPMYEYAPVQSIATDTRADAPFDFPPRSNHGPMSAFNNPTLSRSLTQSQCPFNDLLREDEWWQSFAATASSAASALSINPYPASPTSIDSLVPGHDEYLAKLDGTRYPLVEVMDNLKDEERTPPVSPLPFQSYKTPKREPKVEHNPNPSQKSDDGKLQYVPNTSTLGSSSTPNQTREQQRRRQRSYEQKYRMKRRDVLRRSRRQWLQLELEVAQLKTLHETPYYLKSPGATP